MAWARDIANSIVANLVAALVIALGFAAWAWIKSLPAPAIGVIALGAFGLALWVIHQLRDSLASGFEFFDTRAALARRHPLPYVLRDADVIWALWNTGTRVATEAQGELGRIRRLLLPNPSSETVEALGKLDNMPVERITATIRALTTDVRRHGGNVKWYVRPPGNTVLIGNPNTGHGWAQVELWLPDVAPNDRPSFRVYERGKYRGLYHALVRAYDELWGRPANRPPDEPGSSFEDSLFRGWKSP